MYIHLLSFEELPNDVYKVILTKDDQNSIKNIHQIFYTIKNINTYKLENINSEIFTNILEFMSSYNRHKHFIYCYNLISF